MNENIKTSVHKYYNTKVPILSHWSTTRNKAATLSPEEYEFLYEIVTTNPVYSKKAKLLQDTLHHYQDRKSVNSPLPLIFKQAVYLLAYDLCRGDYYDVAQKKALEDVGLAHNSFSKWWMHPKEDYLLTLALVYIIIGVIILFCPNIISNIFSVVLGIWIILEGLKDFQTTLEWKDIKSGYWTATLI